jgi:hypothetical protein
VAELTTIIDATTIKNSIIFIILLYMTSKFIFIVSFCFRISIFYVDCIHSGITVVYKLIFQYFRIVLCNNNSESFLKTCKSFFKSNFFIMMKFYNLQKEIKNFKMVNLK